MTPHESRMVQQQRSLLVIATLSNGLIAAASMQVKLGLVGLDMGKMATSTGQLVALVNLGNLFLGPVVGGLSDRFGRLPFMWLPVLGRLWWGVKMMSVQSIERYQEIGALAFGVFSAGAYSIQQAALDDLFGSRPHLNARIQASNAVWATATGLIAPIIGTNLHDVPHSQFRLFRLTLVYQDTVHKNLSLATQLTSAFGFCAGAEIARRDTFAAMALSAGVWALQIPVLMFSSETLPRDEQKTFSLRKADPLRNISVLLRNGPVAPF